MLCAVIDAERRSARLLFSRELAAGTVQETDLDRPDVRAAVRAHRVPPWPVRVAQRVAMKRGRLGYLDACVEPFQRARRAVLGDRAAGPPRVLVRMDEFPHYETVDQPARYGTEHFRRFHEILAEAGVPYLVAVVPTPAHAPLDPQATGARELDDGERAVLDRLAADGVTFATHGLDHRTRHASPRRHSELSGLPVAELEERLDRSHALLAEAGIEPRVFVPPFNRFDTDHYQVLARRYDVVCGGDQTVVSLGHHRTPLWRGDAVYLPAYAPATERAPRSPRSSRSWRGARPPCGCRCACTGDGRRTRTSLRCDARCGRSPSTP